MKNWVNVEFGSTGSENLITTPLLDSVLDFLANITASLAWPITILVIAIIYRKHIVEAFNNLKTISFGGAEATFERVLKKATETTKSLEPSDPSIERENNPRMMELIQMSAISPSGAIVEAWKDIEQAARNVVENSGLSLSGKPSRPYFNLQIFLKKNNLLPDAEIETFRELRLIRNRAAHAGEYEITIDQAQQYVRLADRLIDAIKTLSANKPNQIDDV